MVSTNSHLTVCTPVALLIDRDAAVRTLGAKMLHLIGYEAFTVQTWAAVPERFLTGRGRVSLVVCEAGNEAASLCQQLRCTGVGRIVLTFWGEQPAGAWGEDVAWLRKPISLESLRRAILGPVGPVPAESVTDPYGLV